MAARIVPFAPGGAVDTTARILALKMEERLGWKFVIENRPGGNGFIGSVVVRALPGGPTKAVARQAGIPVLLAPRVKTGLATINRSTAPAVEGPRKPSAYRLTVLLRMRTSRPATISTATPSRARRFSK